GLPLVEDACEALGALYADGTPVGGRGHPSVFAFYPNKQITTGEGGMVTTGEPRIKAAIDAERNQGRASGMAWLDHDRLGFNYRLSEIARALAAVGIQTRPYLPAIHLQRFYRERFGHREGEFPVCEDFSARSLALPFFPHMTEGQILRVAEAVREVAG